MVEEAPEERGDRWWHRGVVVVDVEDVGSWS